MNIRAAILLGGAVTTMASAGFAQSYNDGRYDGRYGSGPQSSTPSEMQQTDQLNQQSMEGTTQSPAVLNGEQSAQNGPIGDEPPDTRAPYEPRQTQYTEPSGQPGYGTPNYQTRAQYSQPQSQYESQQQQYQDQMRGYRDQQRRYSYDRDRYERNLRDYDVARFEWSYPAPLAYHYGDEYGLQPLYLMAEPSQQLWQVPVEGPGGRWVGRVRNVDIAPDGRPLRVEIALNRRVSVWVRSGNLRFDPNDRILYTDLSRGDLWTMPGATIVSAPL